VPGVEDYRARLTEEVDRFSDVEVVHDLPAIYGYWAVKFCLPLFEELGYSSLEGFYDDHVAEVCERRAPERARLVSLGAGNGDIELEIARRLRERGIENLELVLMELNQTMLARAHAEAAELGIGDRVSGVKADLNTWKADGEADIYFASHSLHHVVELEHLFDEVKRSLRPDGVLLVNDMIGRNGHQRWPEAAYLVNRIWSRIPERYRYNPIHKRVDAVYPDVDYSTEGFEGIRAEDILPLLLERFHPDAFVTFMNVIDPFVDRIHGRNVDPESEEDRHFIDLVAELDDAALDLGIVTPTHLVGSFHTQPCEARYPRGRSPELVLRDEPPSTDELASERIGRLESELAETRARYDTLRSRKAVRAGLRIADFVRHPIRSRGW
jgi:SAM-dependent methyltransferase